MHLSFLAIASSCCCSHHNVQAFSWHCNELLLSWPQHRPVTYTYTHRRQRRRGYTSQLLSHGPNKQINSNSQNNHPSTIISSSISSIHQENEISHPVQIHHQGLTATIHVKENESILQALERQSSSSSSTPNNKSTSTALGLSSIPHECRRGNCLTCASRLLSDHHESNIQPNINHGLSPRIGNDLTKNGFILTCCSYITGPGVTLELEQNEEVWDRVYRSRFDNLHQLGMEVRARQLRRVDESNVGGWKERMEKLFHDDDNDSL